MPAPAKGYSEPKWLISAQDMRDLLMLLAPFELDDPCPNPAECGEIGPDGTIADHGDCTGIDEDQALRLYAMEDRFMARLYALAHPEESRP